MVIFASLREGFGVQFLASAGGFAEGVVACAGALLLCQADCSPSLEFGADVRSAMHVRLEWDRSCI